MPRRRALASLGAAFGLCLKAPSFCAVPFPGVVLSGRKGRSDREPEPLKPIGKAKGIKPGRVVWAFDPRATAWKGVGNGFWWEPEHTSYERVEAMLQEAVKQLAGEGSEKEAWQTIFRHFNKARGKGDVGYKQGEKIAIKVNFVGMIFHEGCVDPKTYHIYPRHINYMNSSPQLICAVLRRLVEILGARQRDITLFDTLAYIADEYFDPIHKRFPEVRWVDFAGRFGRLKPQPSRSKLYWSSRPKAKADILPSCIAEAEYLINIANLKAHTGAGITLCAKNHFGSLIRWPVQRGFYNLHRATFSKSVGIYRPLVDLIAHNDLGGKTVLYFLDGLYSGKHPIDRAPRRWRSQPFGGCWTSSIFVSQDPVAIDSVGFDFLRTEYEDYPRAPGVDDYLHEAALAEDPPSGTLYNPNTPGEAGGKASERRLGSLGAHEHWNNPEEKRYSRDLGKDEGIELIKCLF